MVSTPNDMWSEKSAGAHQAFADLLASNAIRSSRRQNEYSAPRSKKIKPEPLSNDSIKQAEDLQKTPWYDTPVAKGIIDALSVGSYTTAAIGNSIALASQKAQQKDANGNTAGPGAFLGELFDQTLNHNPVVMGIKAGFGDDDSKRTWSDVVKTNQVTAGIDPDSESARKVSAGLGLAGDIILDPLWLLPTGAASAAVKGAIQGGSKAGDIAKQVAKGADSLGQETSRIKGAIQGAKDGRAEFKATKASKAAANAQRSQLNAGIKAGVSPDVLESTVVKGFDYLPESVRQGSRKATKKEMQAAIAADSDDAIDGMAAAVPRGSTVPSDVPSGAGRTGAPAASELPGVLSSAHKFVEPPNSINLANHMENTPIDQFVKGTSELETQVPVYSAAQNKKVIDAINSHPGVALKPGTDSDKIWSAEKPNILDMRKDLFSGVSSQPSLAQMQEMINSFGVNVPTKSSGSFMKIMSSYNKGTMPLINRGKLESFAKDFFKLPEDADPKLISSTFTNFVKDNSAEIQRVSRQFAPMATDGRLSHLVNAGSSKALGLVDSLPVGRAEQFARPLRPQEADSALTEMGKITEAEIINGVQPELVAQAADKIYQKHVLQYSTPISNEAGEVLRTRRGFSTADEKLNSGGARKEYMWTTHSIIDQMGMIRPEVKKIVDSSPELKAFRDAREAAKGKTGVNSTNYRKAQALYREQYQTLYDDVAMRIYAGVDHSMKESGLFGYLTNVMPTKGIALRLSGYDVLKAIGPELRKAHLWAEKGNIQSLQVTQMADLMETLIRATGGTTGTITDKELFTNAAEVLRGNFARNSEKAGINRVIESNLDDVTQAKNTEVMESAIAGGKFPATKNMTPAKRALNAREKVYNTLIDTVIHAKGEDGMTALQRGIETTLRNTSLDSAQLSTKIMTVSEDHLAMVRNALENDSFGKVFDTVTAVVRGDKLEPEATKVLEEAINNINGSVASPAELTSAKAQKAVIKSDKKGINAANADVAKATENPAIAVDTLIDTAKTADPDYVVDMFRQQEASDIAHRWTVMRRLFNNRFGKYKTYDQITMGMHGTTQIETAFHAALNEYATKYSSETAGLAFRELQTIDGAAFEAILSGANKIDPQVFDLARLTSNIFDPSKSNIFVRNGIGPETMNRILDNMDNIPKTWRFNPELEPAEMAAEWKKWTDISNPYIALSAIHTAMMKATTDISAGARFTHSFGVKSIPVGESGKWAKLGNLDEAKAGGKGEFLNLIDTSLYYPKEIIAELPMLNKFITGSRSFKNEHWKQWVASFDEFTSALKLTQTVMKPGHHVMSITGDYFRNSLAGVHGNGAYKETWRVIRAMNQGDKGLSELDKFANLKTAMSDPVISNSRDGMKIHLAGNKEITVSYRDLYTQFANRGIFLPAHNGGVAEDFLSIPGQHFENLKGSPIANAVTKASRATNKTVSGLVNNKFIKINSFTAQRDNLMRGALAIDMIKKGHYKTLEEAIDAAEVQVRKWAPIAKDLTHAESKYVRRVFLYYTWIRGMIPRVAESLIAKPSLSTMPSKAMYAMAESNGLDPASFGDPFDPEQIFPSYYKEGILGPQWEDPESGHLWGMNPTSPIMDVLNSIGSGVSLGGFIPGGDTETNYDRIFQTLAGMTNPLIRSPFELGAGVNAGTGAPIKDKAQYLLDMPGPVRLASKISGKTFNPTIGGVVNRTEAKFSDGLEGDDFWNNAGTESLNWLTGMQFRDYTSDAAMKTAEFEAKDVEKQQKINEQRRGN